jgi:hypothetical protein
MRDVLLELLMLGDYYFSISISLLETRAIQLRELPHLRIVIKYLLQMILWMLEPNLVGCEMVCNHVAKMQWSVDVNVDTNRRIASVFGLSQYVSRRDAMSKRLEPYERLGDDILEHICKLSI